MAFVLCRLWLRSRHIHGVSGVELVRDVSCWHLQHCSQPVVVRCVWAGSVLRWWHWAVLPVSVGPVRSDAWNSVLQRMWRRQLQHQRSKRLQCVLSRAVHVVDCSKRLYSVQRWHGVARWRRCMCAVRQRHVHKHDWDWCLYQLSRRTLRKLHWPLRVYQLCCWTVRQPDRPVPLCRVRRWPVHVVVDGAVCRVPCRPVQQRQRVSQLQYMCRRTVQRRGRLDVVCRVSSGSVLERWCVTVRQLRCRAVQRQCECGGVCIVSAGSVQQRDGTVGVRGVCRGAVLSRRQHAV